METTTFSEDLRRYLGLLWHWCWLLVLSTLLAAGIAFLISKNSSPVYQASTLALINEAPSNKAIDYSAVMTNERMALTYAEVMTTRPVLEGVAERLVIDISPEELEKMVQVQLLRNTQLLQVSVEDTDPNRASLIANALVLEFAEQNLADQASRFAASKKSIEAELAHLDGQIQETVEALGGLGRGEEAERSRLESTLAQYRQTYASLLQSSEQLRLTEAQSTSSVLQKEPAVTPRTPIRPRTLTNTLLAGIVGLMLAVGIIFLVEALDDTLKGSDEVARELGLPVLGLIVRHAAADGLPVAMTEPRSPVAEAFRALRTGIQFAAIDKPIRTLLVSSPSPSEGKTTVAANLAAVLSQGGKRVVLIDADLRRPRMHRQLKLANRTGMSDLFVQPEIHLNGNLQPAGAENLWALTSGRLPPNPSELLGSEKMSALVDLLKSQFDMVIIDTPPCLAVTDAAVLAAHVDGVVLVMKPGQTRLPAAKGAVDGLRRVGASLLGVVLNDVEFKRSRYSYYHYKEHYYAAYGTAYGGSKDHPEAPRPQAGKPSQKRGWIEGVKGFLP